jgi:hypothetical protein
MRRRVLLSAMAGGALAGCLGDAEPTDDERLNDDASTENDHPNGDDSPDPFGLPADETEFEGIVNGDVDRVVTTEAFDPDEVPIYFHRSPPEADLPADVAFTLENGSGEGFRFGPHHTVVWKIVEASGTTSLRRAGTISPQPSHPATPTTGRSPSPARIPSM